MNPGLPSLDRRRLLGAGVAVLASGMLAACSKTQPPLEAGKFNSVDLTGADYPKGFSLLDSAGETRTLADFGGKIVVVFFGFTQCPDVCPTTLAELTEVRRLLGTDGDKLQVVLITVDPDRDTATILRAYMSAFDPTFVALRPTAAQLASVAKDFKMYYKRVDGDTPGVYNMDHTAGTYIFDQQGHIRLFGRYGDGAAKLFSDIKLLLKSA